MGLVVATHLEARGGEQVLLHCDLRQHLPNTARASSAPAKYGTGGILVIKHLAVDGHDPVAWLQVGGRRGRGLLHLRYEEGTGDTR
eukprot:2765765-Prymnesium_polylepis.1